MYYIITQSKAKTIWQRRGDTAVNDFLKNSKIYGWGGLRYQMLKRILEWQILKLENKDWNRLESTELSPSRYKNQINEIKIAIQISEWKIDL